jgi:hypothetical protein
MKTSFLVLMAFATVLSVSLSNVVLATPARVLIIRHGEKPADPNNPDLSPQGYARAQALTKLFQIHPTYVNLGLPVAYFAAAYDGTNAKRAIETISPLAQSYNQTVLVPYPGKDGAQLAKLILQDPSYDGKTVMIAWVHERIPVLVQALGAISAPDKWDGSDVFDRVWILDFTNTGIQFSDQPESVLPGDSNY